MLGAAALSAWMMVSLTRGAAGRGRASDPESKKEAASQRRPPHTILGDVSKSLADRLRAGA